MSTLSVPRSQMHLLPFTYTYTYIHTYNRTASTCRSYVSTVSAAKSNALASTHIYTHLHTHIQQNGKHVALVCQHCQCREVKCTRCNDTAFVMVQPSPTKSKNAHSICLECGARNDMKSSECQICGKNMYVYTYITCISPVYMHVYIGARNDMKSSECMW